MLTKDDEKKIKSIFKEELRIALSKIEKELVTMNANMAQGEQLDLIGKKLDKYSAILQKDTKINHDDLKLIREKLDEFLDIMKHFAREQKILIKKMREIEKYFDPPGRN